MNPQGPYDPNNTGPTPPPPPQGQPGNPYARPGNAYGHPGSPPYPPPGNPYGQPGVDPRTGQPWPHPQGMPPYGYGLPPQKPKPVLWPIFLIVGLLAFVFVPAAYLLVVGKIATNGLGRKHETLTMARAGHVTKLTSLNQTPDPLPDPPSGFHYIRYPDPLGQFPALVANPVGNGALQANGKHPAIIWITGGFSNSIDDTPWAAASPDNDQSASAFHLAGIPTVYPTLRGGNGNPGYNETCYGEVDDVLAAAKYVASQPDIDPTRIYLAGHSTGGTVALLAAESSDMFRAVFCFGPVHDTAAYGQDQVSYNVNDSTERELRAPIEWLDSVKSPTFVIEGDGGNISCLRRMQSQCLNPKVHFIEVPNADHFSELARTTPVIAHKIDADTGSVCNITVDESDWPSNG